MPSAVATSKLISLAEASDKLKTTSKIPTPSLTVWPAKLTAGAASSSRIAKLYTVLLALKLTKLAKARLTLSSFSSVVSSSVLKVNVVVVCPGLSVTD